MRYNQTYAEWRRFARDAEIAAELLTMEDNEAEIKNRFSSVMSFGTAGLRSKLGAGTNRMNVYTVARATQGIAAYVKKYDAQLQGMVIAYDTRRNSEVFAKETARVLAANGIKTYLFQEATSVPELSFAIRSLKAFGGVAITASHNPKEYNGYKAYASWGGQLLGAACEEVTEEINKVNRFDDVKRMDIAKAVKEGRIIMLGQDMDEQYYSKLVNMTKKPENIQKFAKDIHAVYTPLFGTGMRTFAGVMTQMPYECTIVESQSMPNEDFPGLDAPNPEDPNAMKQAIELAKEMGADIALGTDPDSDRLGAAIPNEQGEWIMMSGNQVGCVIIDYLLRHRKESGQLSSLDYIVKSFVSTRMADDIAGAFGIESITVPTGFKYISDIFNNQRKQGAFVFGFEESCGFLAGDFVADKDGVMAGLLLLEVLCECKKNVETLYQRLRSLYEQYGWHKEKVVTAMLEGEDGMQRVKNIMQKLRDHVPTQFGGQQVISYTDYQGGFVQDKNGKMPIDFPQSNAVCFTLEKGWICVRPSGTEPKLRVYCGVCDTTREASDELLTALEKEARALLQS